MKLTPKLIEALRAVQKLEAELERGPSRQEITMRLGWSNETRMTGALGQLCRRDRGLVAPDHTHYPVRYLVTPKGAEALRELAFMERRQSRGRQ